jgi:pre-mRNA-processing factor 6
MFQLNEKPNFLGKPAPEGYVAGIGRGATGFTTRSDIGPARSENDITISIERDGRMSYTQRKKLEGEHQKSYQDQSFGTPFANDAVAIGTAKDDEGTKDEYNQAANDEDDAGLFADMPYTQEDEEADAIYGAINDYMGDRRKKQREEREQQEMYKLQKEKPKIQQQFTVLKRGLAQVTSEEWAAIPDIGDARAKKQQKRHEKFTPLSDAILEKARQDHNRNGIISSYSNGTESVLADFAQIGEAREVVLGARLDRISDSFSGQTNIDPKGYLTGLDSIIVKSEAEIGDIKKARLLLKSITSTNPKNPQGWIAAARLEEIAGKMVDARDMIAKGCKECPSSEDIWLEAARLNKQQNAKILLAEAVQHLPYSIKIWLQAANFETDMKLKKRVLRRGKHSKKRTTTKMIIIGLGFVYTCFDSTGTNSKFGQIMENRH